MGLGLRLTYRMTPFNWMYWTLRLGHQNRRAVARVRLRGAVPAAAGVKRAAQGGGVIDNKHSTDVESTICVRVSEWAFNLTVSHAPMSVECMFSMTLLQGDLSARPGVAAPPRGARALPPRAHG